VRYQALSGEWLEGSPVGPGPKARTVWVMRPDQTFAVVQPATGANHGTEVEWDQPQFLEPVPRQVEDFAREIVDRHRELVLTFRQCGIETTPAGPEYEAAVAILKQAEAARASRTPFINAHGGNKAISDKRFKELSGE